MTGHMNDAEVRLRAAADRRAPLAIAVSGGIDSLVLATLAHRWSTAAQPLMVHAVSPAVPPAATDRVRTLAGAEGWQLTILSAGEFDDPDYRANPYNRCYFCKSNLYAAIRARTSRTIAAGTNVDDLGDFRPGLTAARESGVVHPYVEAGIDKAGIRALARNHGLPDYAELPAQPCLASRIETGIPIDPGDLRFVDEMERAVRGIVGENEVVRVRIRSLGIFVEVDGDVAGTTREEVSVQARRLCESHARSFVAVQTYRTGSAFVRTSP